MHTSEMHNAPENKAVSPEAAAALNEFNRTFSAFRETNDDRLAQIEQRLSADVITEEKLARIDRALDETKQRIERVTLDAARPRLGANEMKSAGADREHKAAFRAYMRSGEFGGLKGLEEKALSEGSGPDGGYLVPPAAEIEILRRMTSISPIRALASVREISTANFRKAFSTSGPASGWVAETDARPQTGNQQIADMNFRGLFRSLRFVYM